MTAGKGRNVRDAARQYLARGLAPIPVPAGTKRPVEEGWQRLRVTTNTLGKYFEATKNIGILNGAPSHGLVDIDLDAPEALAVAAAFLPPTRLIFGRASKRRSHWIYVVNDDLPTQQFKDCDAAKTMLVERRGTGSQTIWPPSIHPSKEAIDFDVDGEPARVDIEPLSRAVACVATCALLARYWPGAPGSRHDISNALAGLLLNHGVEVGLAVKLVETAAHVAGDEQWRARGNDVRATAKTIAKAKPVTGGPTLAELLGEGVVRKVTDWLGLVSVNCVISVEWASPVEFETSLHGPAVPLEAFPPVLAEYITEVATSYQVPIDLVALASLGVAAAAASRRAEVAIGRTHREPLNLYVAPTAESGERKQFIRALVFPLLEEEKRLRASTAPDIARRMQERAVVEKRIKHLTDQAAKKEDPRERENLIVEAAELEQQLSTVVSMPKLVFDDTTPEYVAKALAEQNGRLAIVSEEAGSLFEVLAGKYTNGVSSLDVHLKAYDGGTIDMARICRNDVHVENPALTILVTPQPVILDRLAEHPDFRERGMVARFLFVLAQSLVGKRRYRDRPIDPRTRDAYGRALEGIFALPLSDQRRPAISLAIADTALDVWKQFADEIEREQADGGRLVNARDWASKHAGRVARISGLFHLIEHPAARFISAETVAAAWTIGQWLEGHALAALGRMGSDPAQRRGRRILDWIRRHGRKQFTLRDLHQHYRDVNRPEELLPALELLESRGFLRRKLPLPGPKRGRPPSPAFEVNPATHAHKSHNSQNGALGGSRLQLGEVDGVEGVVS